MLQEGGEEDEEGLEGVDEEEEPAGAGAGVGGGGDKGRGRQVRRGGVVRG